MGWMHRGERPAGAEGPRAQLPQVITDRQAPPAPLLGEVHDEIKARREANAEELRTLRQLAPIMAAALASIESECKQPNLCRRATEALRRYREARVDDG